MGWFRRRPRDDFKHLAEQRRREEDDRPWFAGAESDSDLHVETGIGSNLSPERDLDHPDPPA